MCAGSRDTLIASSRNSATSSSSIAFLYNSFASLRLLTPMCIKCRARLFKTALSGADTAGFHIRGSIVVKTPVECIATRLYLLAATMRRSASRTMTAVTPESSVRGIATWKLTSSGTISGFSRMSFGPNLAAMLSRA